MDSKHGEDETLINTLRQRDSELRRLQTKIAELTQALKDCKLALEESESNRESLWGEFMCLYAENADLKKSRDWYQDRHVPSPPVRKQPKTKAPAPRTTSETLPVHLL